LSLVNWNFFLPFFFWWGGVEDKTFLTDAAWGQNHRSSILLKSGGDGASAAARETEL
jgi:hypothetical protein